MDGQVLAGLGPNEFGAGYTAAYTCSHFRPQHIVLLIVLEGDDVVTTGIEANGVIPVRLLVSGTDGPEALDNVGVIRHEDVWRDTGEVT